MSVVGSNTRIRLSDAQMALARDEQVQLGIRPQHVSIDTDVGAQGCFPVTAVSHYSIGRERWFDFELAGKSYKGMSDVDVGDTRDIAVKLDVDRLHLFALDGERLTTGAQ